LTKLHLTDVFTMVEVGTGWTGWSGAQPDGRRVCLC